MMSIHKILMILEALIVLFEMGIFYRYLDEFDVQECVRWGFLVIATLLIFIAF